MLTPIEGENKKTSKKIIGQPIIEIEANKEIQDTHSRRKIKGQLCKKCLQFEIQKNIFDE